MMPSYKAQEIDELLEGITGKSRIESITKGECTTCDTPNLDFEDALSEREYSISGMCMDCQNFVWGEE